MPKAKILFIEDDPDQIRLYEFKFSLEGYEMVSAQDGKTGIKMAEKEKQDLILLDILLYEENGIDILRKLKANKKTKNIPVIVFTNFDKEETAKQALALGALSYIIKSKVLPADIVKKVAEVLKK